MASQFLSKSIISAFLVLVSLVASAQSPTSPKIAGPTDGIVRDNVYQNEFLGLKYPLFEGADVALAVPSKLSGAYILLIADQHTGRPQMNRVLITADDSSHYTLSFDRYVSTMVQAQVAQQSAQSVRSPYKVTIAGREFYRAEFDERFGGGVLHKSLACTSANGYFLCWAMLSTVPEELQRLIATLDGLVIKERHELSGAISKPCVPAAVQSDSRRPSRVRVSAGVSQGLILNKVQPEYPIEALKKRIEGAVVLKALISQQGTIKELTVISGNQVLIAESLRAVNQWTYKPYQLNCMPIEVETQIVVNFELSRK